MVPKSVQRLIDFDIGKSAVQSISTALGGRYIISAAPVAAARLGEILVYARQSGPLIELVAVNDVGVEIILAAWGQSHINTLTLNLNEG